MPLSIMLPVLQPKLMVLQCTSNELEDEGETIISS